MQIGEGALKPVSGNKCPICNKAPKHKKTTKEYQEGKGCLSSKPKNLDCKTIPQDPKISYYATAAHHLIPANQCLAKYPRLSQMAKIVGYDVNSKKNGLSLPTVGQKNKNSYYLEKIKFGELVLDDKKYVAFEVMEHVDSLSPTIEFGAQWHTGHHDWSEDTVNQLALDSDNISHADTNYEALVCKQLQLMEEDLAEDETVCEEDENGEIGREVLNQLDGLSKRIRKGIKGWNIYFVSAMSFQYNKEQR